MHALFAIERDQRRLDSGSPVSDRDDIASARRLRALVAGHALAVLIVCLPAAASAEIYKWIDANGRTHYSDQAPKQKARLRSIEDRLSLYTPERGVLQALQARVAGTQPAPSDRVADLERRLQNERLAQPSTDAGKQTAYEQCMAERRTDCDQLLYPPVSTTPDGTLRFARRRAAT
jgi:hypothetical protein